MYLKKNQILFNSFNQGSPSLLLFDTFGYVSCYQFFCHDLSIYLIHLYICNLISFRHLLDRINVTYFLLDFLSHQQVCCFFIFPCRENQCVCIGGRCHYRNYQEILARHLLVGNCCFPNYICEQRFFSHPCFWCLGHPSLPGLSNVNWSYNLRLLSIAKCLVKLFLCRSFQKSYVEIPLTIPAHIQRYWHRENWPQIQIPQECSCGAKYRSEVIKVVFTRHYPIS